MGTRKDKQAALTRRSVASDDQEARSVGQFIDRLGELGWKAQGPRKDYGEDYLVQIWDEGVPSGLSFYVQLKSITNAEKKKGKRTPEVLRYRLEVKDIEHWEVQSVPVVLVVWDVEKRVGYWETIPRIVEALEKDKSGWREKASVNVRVPVENGTDDEGMRRLRWLLADEALKVVRTNRNMSLKITFSERDEWDVAWSAFKNALELGEPTTFDQTNKSEIEVPQMLRRLYGNTLQPTSVTITPNPPKLTIPVRIEVRAAFGIVTIPYVDLRVVKQGLRLITLTNEHQNRPIVFSVLLDPNGSGNFSFRRMRFGHTIQEARETVAFFFAMQQAGSRIRVFSEKDGTKLFDLPIPHQHFVGIEGLYDALEQLAVIEPYTSKYGTFNIDDGIEPDEIAKIALLHDIAKNARATMRKPLHFIVDPTVEDTPSKSTGDVHIEMADCRMQLLGLDIPLGRVRETVCDSTPIIAAMRDAAIRARETGTPIPIHLDAVEIIVEFLDWPPPRDRLQDLATTQSGYFTLNQALEAGFTSAEQLEIHERVERCGEGVYRFLLHPPSEHEDLVVIWLQTEKKCVFSHDTALALHELSDILPVRIHLTVPPGWKPIEGMALVPHAVLHYGTVEPTEIDWMGPVPFTKPLRTLVDCIEKGLTPDLVIQGIDDARRRGIITHAEAERLRLANLKSA